MTAALRIMAAARMLEACLISATHREKWPDERINKLCWLGIGSNLYSPVNGAAARGGVCRR